MFANNGFPSVADIAAAFPNRGNDNGNGMWGDGGWWVLIILLAMWGGFGGNGWGNNGGSRNGQYYTDDALQRGFDTQTIISKLDGLNSGLCSLGYDQLAQMNAINTTVMQTGNALQQAINADTVANMQNTNTISRQIDNCCCETKGAIKDLQYAISQNDCETRQAIHNVGDQIIQNANWNARDLSDAIKGGFAEMERQANARYTSQLENQVNTANRKAELGELYNQLIAYLAPKTNPAFLACNPATGSVIPESAVQQIAFQVYQMLNNNCGCGCGNGFNC